MELALAYTIGLSYAFSMRIPILLCSLTLLVSSCSKEPEAIVESPAGNTATTTEKPIEAPPIVVAKASIASVILSENCPEPPTADEIAPASQTAKGKRSGPSARVSLGKAQCQQSMMQIAFDQQGESAATVEIKAVRVLSKDGEFLAELKTRQPSIWTEDRYGQWNGEIPANSSIKTRYKLSTPNWIELAEKNGSSDSMLILEVELEIGGQLQKVSSEFRRVMAPPAMMIQT